MLRKVRTLILASLLVTGSLALSASPSSATVQDPPAPFNPDLSETCGLDFVLVLDRSGSIANANAVSELEDAAKAFLGSLKNTGSNAAIVSFATTATIDKTAAPVTDATIGAFEAAIDGPYTGGTNWEDGLLKAQAAFPGLTKPLVVMITDGEPTYYLDPDDPTDVDGPGNVFSQIALDHAAAVAQSIKGTNDSPGSHIFALGVGDINETGLKGISGNDKWDGSNFATADWARIDDFGDLDDALRDIATALCGGTITVTKKVGGEVQSGWTFKANAQEQTTGDDGTAQFKFDNVQPLEVNLTETMQNGYKFANASCSGANTEDVTNGLKLTVGPEDIVTCTFNNAVLDADIAVTKTASETTVVAGTNVTYTYEVTNPGEVALGDVTVTDDKCSPVEYVSGDADTDDELDLDETWTYQCTSVITEDTTNTATASGQPPVGGKVRAQATEDVAVVNPDVEIDKTGPAMAHEGDEIEFTITVTNTGDVTLYDLLVADEFLGWSELIDALPAEGENSVSFTVPYTVPADSELIENTATVCPAPVERQTGLLPACDEDGHEVDVIHPAITIDKTADPVAITGSGEVTYTYVVENTGDVTLTDVDVTDDVLGAIGTIASLAPGAKETLTKTVTVDLGSETRNVGTATGTDPLGDPVSDEDDAVITVVAGQTETQDPDPVVTPAGPAPAAPASPAPASPATPVEVKGEVVVQPGATLPRTGAAVAALVLTGLALLTGGLGFRVAGRRRRNEES